MIFKFRTRKVNNSSENKDIELSQYLNIVNDA